MSSLSLAIAIAIVILISRYVITMNFIGGLHELIPVAVRTLSGAAVCAIAAGSYHSVCMTQGSVVYCWGQGIISCHHHYHHYHHHHHSLLLCVLPIS
jgi:hypothetical protein